MLFTKSVPETSLVVMYYIRHSSRIHSCSILDGLKQICSKDCRDGNGFIKLVESRFHSIGPIYLRECFP